MTNTPPEPPHEDFEELWKTLDLDDETLRISVSETIVPRNMLSTRIKSATSSQRPALARSERESRIGLDLEIGSTIGEGGMGIVRLARQRSLHRDVAVKTLHPRGRNPLHQQSLMQEALITGILEHPNIIPVYTIGEDDAGGPVIVMKRIEGVEWSEYLSAGSQLPISGTQDPLTWRLSILMQVCDAIHFAHSKGIIHRDLKPDNIMIGPFREVYLLDWGIAVTLGDDLDGLLPAARDANKIAGTPMYMAPEMTMSDGSLLDRRTDVYLLGSILHEIVTGQPPHSGESMFEVMRKAYLSEPREYSPSIPAELAAICNRAMQVDPERRFQSADELRLALNDFLSHRQSYALSNEALDRLGRLSGLLENDTSGDGEDTVHDIFGECRFAFEQALKVWERNDEARRGLDEALRLMATHELGQENPTTALTHLSRMSEPPPDLVKAAEELEARLASRRKEFDALRRRDRETDPRLGARARSIAALVFGLFCSLSLVGIGYADTTGIMPLTHERYLSFSASLAALTIATFLVFRKALFANRANRRMSIAITVTVGITVAFRAIAMLNEIPIQTGFTVELLIYGFGFALLGFISDLRILAASAVLVIGGIVDALISGDGLYTVAITVFLAFAILASCWRDSAHVPKRE